MRVCVCIVVCACAITTVSIISSVWSRQRLVSRHRSVSKEIKDDANRCRLAIMKHNYSFIRRCNCFVRASQFVLVVGRLLLPLYTMHAHPYLTFCVMLHPPSVIVLQAWRVDVIVVLERRGISLVLVEHISEWVAGFVWLGIGFTGTKIARNTHHYTRFQWQGSEERVLQPEESFTLSYAKVSLGGTTDCRKDNWPAFTWRSVNAAVFVSHSDPQYN